jgi:hypothetical protein
METIHDCPLLGTGSAENSQSNLRDFGGFEVLTEVTCAAVKVNRGFEGTYHLHLQGKGVCQLRNQSMKQAPGRANSVWKTQNLYRLCLLIPASCWLFPCLTLRPWIWKPYAHPKHRSTFIELHGVTSQLIDHWRSRCKGRILWPTPYTYIHTYITAACFMPISCLTYYLTLKMEAIPPSETSVDKALQHSCLLHTGFLLRLLFDPEDEDDMSLRNVSFHRTTWNYIPEGSDLNYQDRSFPQSKSLYKKLTRIVGDYPKYSIIGRFDNTVQCDSNIHLFECLYMFRSSYDYLQKAQHVEETTIT